MSQPIRYIAHRGLAGRYPENTLRAFSGAIEAHADAIELDVQIAACGTPVVFHDQDLMRVTGHRGRVADLPASELHRYSAHEPARLGERYAPQPIPTLAEATQMLLPHAALKVFIEIKEETLVGHPLQCVVQQVLADSAALAERRVIISFAEKVLQAVRPLAQVPIGWVLPSYDEAALARARELAPEFLFVDLDLLPPAGERLAEGSWEWAVYEVTDHATVDRLTRQGVNWIESMVVDRLRGPSAQP